MKNIFCEIKDCIHNFDGECECLIIRLNNIGVCKTFKIDMIKQKRKILINIGDNEL
jgi:hypothetical protein